MLGFLYGMLRGDEHAARDALQETFFRFYTALTSFQQGRPLRPWLIRIARNVVFDHWKRSSTKAERPVADPPVPAEERTPDDVVAAREAAGLLRDAVHGLPAKELAVFLLKHDQGLTYTEVADALSCSVRTAKYRMRAALEALGREAERLGVEG